MTTIVSPQKYLNHPFEATLEEANTPRRLADATGKKYHKHKKKKNWEPIRIHVDSTYLSELAKRTFSRADRETLNKITSSIIPLVIKVLSKYLHVIRVNGNLMVNRNFCHGVPVPEAHKTIGIPNADYVVYLTANEANHGHTIAGGAACTEDQYGRPTSGMISLYLAGWRPSLSKNYIVRVMVHEMSHALGWSADFFPKFRDELGYLRANADGPVITSTNALGKRVSFLTTPAVTRLVRSLFGCSSLAGMEIEDQGGSSTAGSQPEMRIYPESYMAGSSNSRNTDNIIDAMALSVFRDSGWYQVKHLDTAGRLSFGRGMGCRVATHKCNDWGKEAGAEGMFCAKSSEEFCTGNVKQALGKCTLAK